MSQHPHHFACRLLWTGANPEAPFEYDTYSRAYRIEIEGKPPIEGSSSPEFRGDTTRPNPEDLLVAALSACHFLSYIALCARRGIHVVAYSDSASGRMEEVYGVVRFTDVLLRPRVTVRDSGAISLARSLHEPAHASCFIASSVNFPVRNEPTIVLDAADC